MSAPTRGRALILNNQTFTTAELPHRVGAEVDLLHIKALKFQTIVHHDLSAKNMMAVMEKETHEPDHVDLGMFTLVIMSHGTQNECVYGTDGVMIKLGDVYDILSPQRFPHMSGKPKFIAVQACAGARKHLGAQGIHVYADKPSVNRKPDSLVTAQPIVSPTSSSSTSHLNVDDLIIIKSSFGPYSSERHREYGSLFIRCLVATLYKHANHRDLWTLCEVVQRRVRDVSLELVKKYPNDAFGQVPSCSKTLTKYRRVYLFPGYNGPRKQ